ncbi:MAG: TonB-dependent receptor [Pseudomonadota bacterium]
MAQAQDAPAASGGGVIVLDPIIVTARRVEEELGEAPVAVSVQTEEDFSFEKVDEPADLANRAPNVIAFDSNGQSFVIRGVGSQSIQGLNSEVGVGIFLDGVYVGRPDSAPEFLFDLERAEIVRGTQSSIYGRNTIGGAVNLISRRPGEEPLTELEFTYGTDGLGRAKVAFDRPLTDDGRWLSRTALAFTRAPDGIDNIATGEDDRVLEALNGRFTVTGELDSGAEITFSLDLESVDDKSLGGFATLDLAFDKKSDLDFPGRRQDDRAGAFLRIDQDFSGFWFQSTTSIRGTDQDLFLDGDFTSTPTATLPALQQGREQELRQFSQEFRIGSFNRTVEEVGEISWNAGLFLLAERFDGFESFDLAFVPSDLVSRNNLENDSTAASLYGNATWQATENLSVFGGLRYTYEESDADVEVSSPSGTDFFGTPMAGSEKVTSDNLSPEIGLTYRFDDETLAFARVTSGFKSGGIAQFFNADGSVNTFDDETAWTYEIGFKTEFLGGRAAIDVTAFYTDWSDLQANVFISDIQRVTANAASAESKGIEIGLDSQLSEELRLRAAYGFLDTEFTDFEFTFFSFGAGTNITQDFSGNPLPLAPEHTATLTLDWERELRNGRIIGASGTYTYRDRYTFDPEGAYRQPETHILDASVSYEQDGWTATLWGNNLTDEDYLTNYFRFGTTDVGIAARGRTFGVTVSREF